MANVMRELNLKNLEQIQNDNCIKAVKKYVDTLKKAGLAPELVNSLIRKINHIAWSYGKIGSVKRKLYVGDNLLGDVTFSAFSTCASAVFQEFLINEKVEQRLVYTVMLVKDDIKEKAKAYNTTEEEIIKRIIFHELSHIAQMNYLVTGDYRAGLRVKAGTDNYLYAATEKTQFIRIDEALNDVISSILWKKAYGTDYFYLSSKQFIQSLPAEFLRAAFEVKGYDDKKILNTFLSMPQANEVSLTRQIVDDVLTNVAGADYAQYITLLDTVNKVSIFQKDFSEVLEGTKSFNLLNVADQKRILYTVNIFYILEDKGSKLAKEYLTKAEVAKMIKFYSTN